jgi:hypothetical protein
MKAKKTIVSAGYTYSFTNDRMFLKLDDIESDKITLRFIARELNPFFQSSLFFPTIIIVLVDRIFSFVRCMVFSMSFQRTIGEKFLPAYTAYVFAISAVIRFLYGTHSHRISHKYQK